jgi:hypothetical protein
MSKEVGVKEILYHLLHVMKETCQQKKAAKKKQSKEDLPGMQKARNLLVIGRLMDASCTNQVIQTAFTTEEHILGPGAALKTNSLTSVSTTFISESQTVDKTSLKSLVPQETVREWHWSGAVIHVKVKVFS